VRFVRSISRMDCCAKMGATSPPATRIARAWPGVASPSRSPSPALAASPRGRGRSHGRTPRRAAALRAEAGPSSNTFPRYAPVRPSKPERRAGSLGASTTSRGPPGASANSISPMTHTDPGCRSKPLAKPRLALASSGLTSNSLSIDRLANDVPGDRRDPLPSSGLRCPPQRERDDQVSPVLLVRPCALRCLLATHDASLSRREYELQLAVWQRIAALG